MAKWEDIQEDVLTRIIALLPPDDIEQLGLVCRAWKQVSDAYVRCLRPRTVPQVTWAKRFPQLLRLDLSSASYDQFGDLVRSDMDSPESDSGEALGTEDAIVPGTVTELAWGSEQSDDLVTGSSAQCRSPFLTHGDRRWLVINIFSNRLPGCVSVTSLEVAGQAETYAMCSHAMAAPSQWAHFLSRLQHLRLSNSSNTTAAAAVCLCLSTSLTSMHISGSPGIQALTALPAIIPYISPENPVPLEFSVASSPSSPMKMFGIIPVPVLALQLIASAALHAKQRLPCHLPHCHPDSTPTDTSTSSPAQKATAFKDHAVILPRLHSITTDADRFSSFASIGVLEQHPPTDLLTCLPNSLPQRQQDESEASSSMTICLSNVAAAAAARALTLPTTPASAPAWLVAHPGLMHLDASNATLLPSMSLLTRLTTLCLKQMPRGTSGLHPSAGAAASQLHSLTFPFPASLQSGPPRTLPPPGICPHLTQLHLSPPDRTSLPFSTLARLVFDCPALEDLNVSRCLTAPPAAVIAPRAATPVHYFLHTQTDLDAEGSLPECSPGGRRQPAALRRFACDNAPGCLYLLPLLDTVRPVRQLEDVSASDTLCLPGRLLALLAEQPRLQRLQLFRSSRAISPPQDTAVLALVALATALTALSLSPSNSSCTQACAIALAAVLPGLQGLRALSLPSVTASHSAAPLLRALAGITGLTSLDVSHGLVCDADLDVLVKCSPWLSSLSLSNTLGITDAGVHTLLRLPALESLDLTACAGVGDDCGTTLACLTSLTWLSLACTGCSAAAARDVATLPRLRHVTLCPHWQLHTGRGKGGTVLLNRVCNTMQREDMVVELAQCARLRRVDTSACLLAKARSQLMYEGAAAPLWMS